MPVVWTLDHCALLHTKCSKICKKIRENIKNQKFIFCCRDLGITDRAMYISVTRVMNLLKKYDDILLADHTLQYNGFEDMGKKLVLKICRD